MPRTPKTYSIDHPRIREAGFSPQARIASPPLAHQDTGLLRAARDRLPRWG